MGLGKQPVIIYLARALANIRLPVEWRKALDSSRLLILSPFDERPRLPKTESAHCRNKLVAALSDEALIIHADSGGSVEHITMLVDRWSIPRRHPRING